MKYKLLILILIILSVSSCRFNGMKMSTVRMREAQKDTVIGASFKGLYLGHSREEINTKIDELEMAKEIFEVKTNDSSEEFKDCLIIIDGLSLSQTTNFRSKLALKDGDNYKEVDITCYLGFIEDSLYAIVVRPSMYRTELERNNTLDTYTSKYGLLYFEEETPIQYPYHREYYGGDGWQLNKIYETTAYSSNNLVWKYKDANIYLCDMTVYETIYTYDEDSFRRELFDLELHYYVDQYKICEKIKERLYGRKTNIQKPYSFIAYKYIPIHNREVKRIEEEIASKAQEYDARKAQEDSISNAKAQEQYLRQDI